MSSGQMIMCERRLTRFFVIVSFGRDIFVFAVFVSFSQSLLCGRSRGCCNEAWHYVIQLLIWFSNDSLSSSVYFWLSLILVDTWVTNVDELGSKHHVWTHINEHPGHLCIKNNFHTFMISNDKQAARPTVYLIAVYLTCEQKKFAFDCKEKSQPIFIHVFLIAGELNLLSRFWVQDRFLERIRKLNT